VTRTSGLFPKVSPFNVRLRIHLEVELVGGGGRDGVGTGGGGRQIAEGLRAEVWKGRAGVKAVVNVLARVRMERSEKNSFLG